MTRHKTVALCFSKRPFASGDDAWAQRLARSLNERGHQVDLVTVPLLESDADDMTTTALRWRLVELRNAGRTRVDLAVCGDPAAAFVGHPTRVLWLERRQGETGGLAAALDVPTETTAGRLTASGVARASTIIVASPDDGALLQRTFARASGRVQAADAFLSSFPYLDGRVPSDTPSAPNEPEGAE